MALIKFEATDGSVYLDDVAIPLVVEAGEAGESGQIVTITTAEGTMDITLDNTELEAEEVQTLTTTALVAAIDAGIADVYKIPVMKDVIVSQDYLEAPVITNITAAGPTPPPAEEIL